MTVHMESFSSSYHHNKSQNGSPVGRIVMAGPRILYKNRTYSSASDALHDYISEFKGDSGETSVGSKCRKSDSFSKDVLDLLTSQAKGNETDKALGQVGLSYSSGRLERKLNLQDLQSSTKFRSVSAVQNTSAVIEDAYNKMLVVDNAICVADTLNKSHDVLQKVETDRLSDVAIAPSDSNLQSVATESLISIDPLPPIPSPVQPVITSPNILPRTQHKGHVYSYRTPRSRAHTVSGISLNHFSNPPLSNYGNRHFTESTSSNVLKPPFDINKFSPVERRSRQHEPIHPRRASSQQFRSRSVSPSASKTGHIGPPSWIKGLDYSSDSHADLDKCTKTFKDVAIGRKTPSWIDDIVGSAASSVSHTEILAPTTHTLRLGMGSTSNVSDTSELRTSESSAAASLKMSDLEHFQGPDASKARIKGRHSSNYVTTSTPMKNHPSDHNFRPTAQNNDRPMYRSVPSLLNGGVEAGRRSLTNSRLSGDSGSFVNSDSRQINQMLSELDRIREKLKSSSQDTYNCLRSFRPKGDGGTNYQLLEKKEKTNPVNQVGLPSDIDFSREGLDGDMLKAKPLASTCDLTGISSIPKDHDQANRTLSISQELRQGSSKSGLTEDILDGDRPWERPITAQHRRNVSAGSSTERCPLAGADEKSGVIQNFLKDCLQGDEPPEQSSEELLSGGPQPGSMEALKNMLFRLQREASNINNNTPGGESPGGSRGGVIKHRHTDNNQEPGTGTLSHLQKTEDLSPVTDANPLDDYDFTTEPGGQCLERALVHLSRLKTLVQRDTFNPSTRPKSSSQPTPADVNNDM